MKGSHFSHIAILLIALLWSATPGWADIYTKITTLDELTDGKYVIAYGDESAMKNEKDGTRIAATTITVPDYGILNPDASIVWDITTTENGKSISNGNVYAGFNGNRNTATLYDSFTAENCEFTFSVNDDATFKLQNVASPYYYLQYNTNSKWFACYTDTQKDVTLYKFQGIGKNNPELSFTSITGNIAKILIDDHYNSVATTASDAPIVYSSSNQEVATIDQTGVVTMLAGGTTVIKAEVAETETFYAVSIQYTLTVFDSGLTKIFTKVTKGPITNGKYLIVYQGGDNASSVMAMNSTNYGKYFECSTINLYGDKIPTDDQSIIWDINQNADGTYTISNNELFVNYRGSSTSTNLTNTVDRSTTWDITLGDNNTFQIANTKTSDRLLRYKYTNRFASYSSFGSETNPTFYRLNNGKSYVSISFNKIEGLKISTCEKMLSESSYNSAATTNPERPITYSSSNNDVATIDATGLVTLVNPGTTIIKATTEADEIYEAASAQYALTIKALSVTLPHEIDFKTGLGDWLSITTIGSAQWEWTSEGAQINGDNAGETEAYLISPEITARNIALAFSSSKNYSGNDLQLLYSTNYDPNTMQPTEAEWIDITDKASWPYQSGEVVLTGLTSPIHVAFKYTCSSNEAAQWTITDLSIQKSAPVVTFNEVSDDKTLYFKEGFTYNSSATANPQKPITYSSSDQEVATIDATGMVTLVGIGATVIKATTEADETYREGIAQYTLTVKASSITLPYITDFKSGLGDWISVTTTGTEQWKSTSEGAQINGHGKDETEAYLISPEITVPNILLVFSTSKNYSGNDLQLLYSTNYDPNTMQPTEAEWIDITDKASWPYISGYVKLTQLASPARIAFKYTCSSNQAAQWTISTLSIQATTSKVDVTFDEVSGDKTLFFEEGLTYNSAATANPERPITYSSENQEVATIDATGTVTLVGPGTTVIKAIAAGDDTYEEGAAQYTLTVRASSVTLPYSTDFKSGLGEWLTYVTYGTTEWESTKYGAQANGFNKGDGETYLVSPAVSASSIVLSFGSEVAFNGPDAQLFYSSNFDPSTMTQPAEATWTEITDMATWASSQETTPSGDIELKNLTAPIRFAFKYTCSEAEGAARWTITGLSIKEGVASGIEDVEANGMKIINGKGQVTIETAEAAHVAIYALTGAQVRQLNLTEGTNIVELPAGIYVIGRQKVVVF